MSEFIKLAAARDLVEHGAVKQAQVIGLPGGWTVQLQTYNREAVRGTYADRTLRETPSRRVVRLR